MLDTTALPLHPTKRHPLTGDPLRAVWVRPDGRVCWPFLGGDDTVPPADGGGAGPGSGTGEPAVPEGNAVDGQGRDLGYPKDTQVANMDAGQQAAYWKHQARGHEQRYTNLLGGRRPEEVRTDLERYAEIQRSQMTPAEQEISKAAEAGKAQGLKEARQEAAVSIFQGALEAGGVSGDALEEIVENFNVGRYIGDDGIDTAKITAFAKRFTAQPGTGTPPRRPRDFGAGHRDSPPAKRGAAGRAEAERRFGKPKTGE